MGAEVSEREAWCPLIEQSGDPLSPQLRCKRRIAGWFCSTMLSDAVFMKLSIGNAGRHEGSSVAVWLEVKDISRHIFKYRYVTSLSSYQQGWL